MTTGERTLDFRARRRRECQRQESEALVATIHESSSLSFFLTEEGHLHARCRQRTRRYCNNRIESDHRHFKRRLHAMQGPRTTATAWAVIQGIEAGTDDSQEAGPRDNTSQHNLFGQAWVFGALLKVA